MADWTVISDTSLDPDAPLTSELAYAWRDNPIAIAEGAVGAPRIQYAAIQAPSAGSGVVVTTHNGVNATAGATTDVLAFSALIAGTATVNVTAVSLAVGPSSFTVTRVRNRTATVVAAITATGGYDIAMKYGDRFFVRLVGGTSTASTASFNISHNGASPAIIVTGGYAV